MHSGRRKERGDTCIESIDPLREASRHVLRSKHTMHTSAFRGCTEHRIIYLVCLGTTLSEFPVMAMAKLQMSATANISDRANAMMTVLTKVELIDLLTMVT